MIVLQVSLNQGMTLSVAEKQTKSSILKDARSARQSSLGVESQRQRRPD